MSFPFGLSSIDLRIIWVKDQARDQGGNSWETEEADPYWGGRATTGKLNHDRLQDAEGFVQTAVRDRIAISFVDPIYYIPATYRGIGLPGGWDGGATLVSIEEDGTIVVAGLPVGLILKRGDRLSLKAGDTIRHHMVATGVVVSSADEQVIAVTPFPLGNVFEAADDVILLNPPVLLNIVPNSWSVARNARQEPTASFQVEEASVT